MVADRINWLLIRGLARETRHWGEFPAHLQSALPGHRLHFLDLPGAGRFHKHKSPLAISSMVCWMRGHWEEIKSKQEGRSKSEDPWGLLTMSLGGMVGLQWCSQFPQDFSYLVAMNSSAGGLARPWQRLKWQGLYGLLGIFLAGKLELRERKILQLTSQALFQDKAYEEQLKILVDLYSAYSREYPLQKANFFRQLLAASCFRAPQVLPKSISLLFLASLRDQMVDAQSSMALARHFQAPLRIHPSAGHDLPLDDPRWVAEQIGQWSHYPQKGQQEGK